MVTTAYRGYDYIVHNTSATGRTAKGMPYLRTLAMSGERIRQVIGQTDKSCVGRRFSDRMALKRFIIGCSWIAEHQDPDERSNLWAYWQGYLREQVLPTLVSREVLAAWCGIMAWSKDAPRKNRLAQIAMYLDDPFSLLDKVVARMDAKRRGH